MKHHLPKLRDQIVALEAFEAKYNVGERGRVGMLSALFSHPEVSFNGTSDGPWIGEKFGKSDWASKTNHRGTEFSTMVDGVLVIVDHAFLTAEAGITLPAEWVQPVAARP